MVDLPPPQNPRLRQGFLDVVRADEKPFGLRPVQLIPGTDIPPRQWIYGTQIVRSYVTLLVAPGGTGKSSYLLTVLIAIALRRPLLSVKIFQQCNTALLNLEDPPDEIDRRLAAIGKHYNIINADLTDRFFINPPDRTVTIASKAADGSSVVFPDERAIIEQVRDQKIGVLGVDPFAESHMLEENSNPEMIQAAAAWRRVARFGDCAVVLVHHARKGMMGNIEAARGAKALSDSARIGLLLSSMTEDECNALAVPLADRHRYVRLDDAKMNLSPRAAKASWLFLNHVELGNVTEVYPNGDQVQVTEAWQPTSVWDGISVGQVNEALDRIAAGLPDGGRFTHTRRSHERWAGSVLMAMFELTEGQAAEMVRVWLHNGVLVKESYHDLAQRKDRVGLTVNDVRRPGDRQ